MKTILLSTISAMILTSAPVFADAYNASAGLRNAFVIDLVGADDEIDRRGRGRGRGGREDSASDDRDDDRDGGRRPRVPGGSGCDDANDIIEHPECRG